jgi:hypothetical protein
VRDGEGEFRPQAFACTDVDAAPLDILRWFVRRWSVEVTFAEVRRHLGVETQRQWSDRAIARTTPALLGLFSLVALWANDSRAALPRSAAWYDKRDITFSDALASVRRALWSADKLPASRHTADTTKIPADLIDRLTEVACYAA